MAIKETTGRRIFTTFNVLLLVIVTAVCILPFIHVLALSLSTSLFVAANEVQFWPKGFTIEAYRFLSTKPEFFKALFVTCERVVLGTAINMFMVIITAYPLSKEVSRFRARTIYTWFFAFTMFFGGGMIPGYMVVKQLHLINSIWALVIPGSLNVWYTVMLLNFFREVPKDIEEAAIIDGASQWLILWCIYLPVSLPAIATITLFTIIGHWNSWFDGILYLNSVDKYPLQTYLSSIVLDQNLTNLKVLTPEQLDRMKKINDLTLKSAQIFLGALPILTVYPFLQRYFIKGITIGSVKG